MDGEVHLPRDGEIPEETAPLGDGNGHGEDLSGGHVLYLESEKEEKGRPTFLLEVGLSTPFFL